MSLITSPSTDEVYSSIGQSLQDSDALNGSPLWDFIYGMVSSIDDVNTLMLDDVGAGVTVQPVNYEPGFVTLAYLSAPMLMTDTSFTIFGTDTSWEQVNTTSAFVVQVESERIQIPGGTYNWSAANVTFTGVTRHYDNTVAAFHNASSGSDGTIDIENYLGAPGWSQVLDITRCPQYALPWLGQFIGIQLAQDNTLTYQQTMEKIAQRSGFQRATTASIIAELVVLINAVAPTPTLTAEQVIVLENTAILASDPANLNVAISSTTATTIVLTNTDSTWVTLGSNSSFIVNINSENILIPKGVYNWLAAPVTITGVTRNVNGTVAATHSVGTQVTLVGGTDIYGFNEYAMTILLPASYLSIYTYASLITAAGGDGTYNALATYIGTLGGKYLDLVASSLPASTSSYISFIYRYRPASIQIFVGGY